MYICRARINILSSINIQKAWVLYCFGGMNPKCFIQIVLVELLRLFYQIAVDDFVFIFEYNIGKNFSNVY